MLVSDKAGLKSDRLIVAGWPKQILHSLPYMALCFFFGLNVWCWDLCLHECRQSQFKDASGYSDWRRTSLHWWNMALSSISISNNNSTLTKFLSDKKSRKTSSQLMRTYLEEKEEETYPNCVQDSQSSRTFLYHRGSGCTRSQLVIQLGRKFNFGHSERPKWKMEWKGVHHRDVMMF